MRAALARWALRNPPPGSRYVMALEYAPTARPEPRWGHGRPPHRRLAELLANGEEGYERVLAGFESYRDELHSIPLRSEDALLPHWQNPFMFGLDGVSLYCFTRERKPRRYLEVGSGNSTLFVHRARRDGVLDTEIVSIDPYPRREIDAVCDRVIREPLETVDLGVFSDLREGDIVFMDGTHRAFTNSDAVVFFMDVLPELAPGVLVGVHDIHLPDDYRPEHTERLYSEQYLLGCMLLGEPSWLEVVLPCWYVSTNPRTADRAAGLTPPEHRGRGVIFWTQTRARAR
jgi:Methyltransferase domain